MQGLFFLLIPLGLIILFLSIRLAGRSFGGNIILEIPYDQKKADFEITEAGNYSIWHKGQIFRKAPLDEFRPVIANESTGEEIKLTSLLLRPNSNNAAKARMEIFRFSIPAGKYRLELIGGSSISAAENAFIRTLPFKMVDRDKYYIQIRKSQPLILMIAGIVLMIIAGFCIIGGLVLGILADTIFKG